jgi:hypothetical protein
MALTNAEKQERYRQRRKAMGFSRKVIWVDSGGFASDCKGDPNARPRLSQRKFARDLNKLMGAVRGDYAEEIYAALFAHAERLKQSYDKTEALVDKAVEEEKAAGRWQ